MFQDFQYEMIFIAREKYIILIKKLLLSKYFLIWIILVA